ncbi:sugar nucleotide-binding protein [archaeon]|jgi:dTDP-4-dehydrorhamnose reductase|nr:sugar nucleotide-binding protein [archaeon]
MKNIILLGTDTMLGHVIYLYLSKHKNYNVTDYYLENNISKLGSRLNISSPESFKEIIENLDDVIIINTLSVLIEESQRYFDRAIYVNSYIPNYISSLINNTNNKLIHISTDCVFSGTNGSYDEDSISDATDNYGKSKALGEVFYNNKLTLRTSKIGPCLRNHSEELFDWFLSQDTAVKGYKYAFWNGVTTLELAKLIDFAIESDINGLYNVAPFDRISKFELLSIINLIFKKNIEIIPDYDVKIDRSILDTRKELKSSIKNYHEMFSELKDFMELHSEKYGHYNI